MPRRPASPWTPEEEALLASLDSPRRIQDFLDAIPYNCDHQCRSPRRVMRDRVAHCMEGALFAAAALRFHGDPPRIVDLRAVRDDDHVVAVFRRRGRWGAVAKSNFNGLRYREPVYRDLRELVMSWFDPYHNTASERSLREYSRPLDLRAFDRVSWMTTEEDLDPIGQHLEVVPHTSLLTEEQIAALTPIDPRTYAGNMVGCDPAGLYQA